jgi:hypothetical protein
MYEAAIRWIREKYPQEHRYVMRLWRMTWRASRAISIAAILVLSIPALVLGFLVGKQFTITNIIMPPAQIAPSATAAVSPSEIAAKQPPQSSTPLEKLITANMSLPAADKERLSNALFSFAQLLDQATAVLVAINITDAELTTAYQTGVIATELESYRGKLIAAQALDKEFEKNFLSERERWKYYQNNFDYVFGPNPDGSMHLARNGIEDFLNYLERWAKIENKTEQPILQLLWWPEIKLHGFVYDFSHWKQESSARLDQVRSSLNH